MQRLLIILNSVYSAFFAVIYTCVVYIFLVGCYCEHLFLVDTHPIGADLGGNGNGTLKVHLANESGSLYQLCVWIWKRLQISGVKAESMQSLMIITEASRYDSVCFGRFLETILAM